jgi:hypothetical protein
MASLISRSLIDFRLQSAQLSFLLQQRRDQTPLPLPLEQRRRSAADGGSQSQSDHDQDPGSNDDKIKLLLPSLPLPLPHTSLSQETHQIRSVEALDCTRTVDQERCVGRAGAGASGWPRHRQTEVCGESGLR